ncbi:MAG: UDP-N-acetylmuramate dehydrogenase [Deltaproteobacteria bacterium]|nr:UDP-N-acetylmuramate dehydrogenase [Deltaproteobacteria bacterium]
MSAPRPSMVPTTPMAIAPPAASASSAARAVPEAVRDAVAAALAAAGTRVRRDEPLARHTSFRIGGPADLFVAAMSVPELQAVLRAAHAYGYPVFFLGGGTNLLVSDRGVRGLVVALAKPFDFVEWELGGDGGALRVGAAVPFKRLVSQTVAAGLAGLEFGEGIPGTIGGGLLMNAGAFGGEIGRVVTALEAVDEGGERVLLPRERLGFAYRRMALPTRAVITAVCLRLARGDAAVLAAAVADAKARRDRHQPKGHPNAGSIFKNPPGAFAGRLIEEAGLKGARLGEAMFSERHANFIVNLGRARAADVQGLIDLATRAVRRQRGIELEPEVRFVGEW